MGLPTTSTPLKLGKGRSTMKELLGSSKEVPFMSFNSFARRQACPLHHSKQHNSNSNFHLSSHLTSCTHLAAQPTVLAQRRFLNYITTYVSNTTKCYCHTWLVYAEVTISHVIFAGRYWQPQHIQHYNMSIDIKAHMKWRKIIIIIILKKKSSSWSTEAQKFTSSAAQMKFPKL